VKEPVLIKAPSRRANRPLSTAIRRFSVFVWRSAT